MILTLFNIPIITLILITLIWCGYMYTMNFAAPNSSRFRNILYYYLKGITLVSFHISLLYSFYLWKYFPHWSEKCNALVYPGSVEINGIVIFEGNHNLNLPFLILSISILVVGLLTAWYSNVNMFMFCMILLLLEIFLVGAFSCTNIFVFLLFFEASALPIFILIAYCGSARRERLKAGYFFLFFTLYGSISLLLLILNFYSLNQLSFISEIPQQYDNYSLWVLLFIAFAVKIPLFPFHIWLPYAHVEASTSTSILLAALLLKLGGYGLLRFMLPLFSMETHLYFRPFVMMICVAGIIYGSLCALRQIDLKRQIAFSSISHMSFASLGIFTFTEIGIKGSIYLMLSHGLTSAGLFYLVGILSERYHTRSIMVFSSLLSAMPAYSFFLIFISLANVGFPGTSGFLPELEVLTGIMSSIPTLWFLTIVGMLLSTVSTLVLLLRMLFGHLKVFYSKSQWVDATKLEFYVLGSLSFWIIVLGFYDILQ